MNPDTTGSDIIDHSMRKLEYDQGLSFLKLRGIKSFGLAHRRASVLLIWKEGPNEVPPIDAGLSRYSQAFHSALSIITKDRAIAYNARF
jgi:hypothetical protein